MTKPLYVYARRDLSTCGVLLVGAASASVDPQQTPKGTNVNPDAGMVADFKKRRWRPTTSFAKDLAKDSASAEGDNQSRRDRHC